MVVVVGIIAILVVLALRGLIVMLLWNWLMPSILGLPEINLFEGIGLVFLAAFLFGSMIEKGALTAGKKVNKGT